MKLCKRIIALFSAIVISVSMYLVPASAAWQNEVGHWYVNSTFMPWLVGGVLAYGGSVIGGGAGTVVLPGGGTIEGSMIGTTVGTALSNLIYDLASYYAAGYTDEDALEEEREFVEGLDSTTAGSGIAVTGFSVGSTSSFTYTRRALRNWVYSSASNTTELFYSLGVNNKTFVFAETASYLYGFYWNENGKLVIGCFVNPRGAVSPYCLGVFSLSDLELYSVGGITNWENLSIAGLYYSENYAIASPDFDITSVAYFDPSRDFTTGGSDNYPRFPCMYSPAGSITFGSSYVGISLALGSGYSASSSSTISWDNSRVVICPTGTDSGSRLSSLTAALNTYNIDNSYTDNSTNVNFFLVPTDQEPSEDTAVSPAIYDEEMLVFTEPATGAQYQTTGWTYDYTTRTYDITLDAGTFSLDGTDVTRIVSTYGDELATITYYDASGNALATDEYNYVMMSGSGCAIEGHSYDVEITKPTSCTATGERTYTCSVCGDQYVEDIPKMDHVYSEHSITQEPTCTVGGISSLSCSVCGTQITEVLDPLGHDWVAKEVTETTYAVPEGTSCPACESTKFASTREDGIYTCACLDCGQEWDVEADITYGGTSYTCTRCGETKVEADSSDDTQSAWFAKFIFKFRWLSSVGKIYKQLVADVTSDAATAAAVSDGEVMLSDVTSGHAATDGSTSYTAPELAISFGDSDIYGVDWANIRPLDLSWYAPHKETVDGILSGILWLSYLFLLIKRAPGIIRGAEMVTEDRIKIDNWNIKHPK